jgi:hypothetical protein
MAAGCAPTPQPAEPKKGYLGEVTLNATNQASLSTAVRPDTPIHTVGSRKPHGMAVLRMAYALSAMAGPLLVYDDGLDQIVVVSPKDVPGDLAEHWPW